MKPEIINKCTCPCRTDYEKIVVKIVERIPDKFLHGLSEIIFSNDGKYLGMQYIIDKKGEKKSKIEINMDYDGYNTYSLFSIFALNIDFIVRINEHIRKFLKPASDDAEILSYNVSRLRYKWMYFGVWSPLIYLSVIVTYPVSKISYFKSVILRWAEQIILKK